VILAHGAFTLAVAAFVLVYVIAGIDAPSLIYPASAVLTTLVCWCVWSWRDCGGSLGDPYCLFLLAATLFNAGHAVLLTLHVTDFALLGGRFDPGTQINVILMTLAGLATMHVGALVTMWQSPQRRLPQPVSQTISRSTGTRITGYFMLAVSIVPAIIEMRTALTAVAVRGYMGLYQREIPTGFANTTAMLAAFLVPGCLFLLAGSARRRFPVLLSLCATVLHVLVAFVLGSRATGAMLIVAYLWVWNRSAKRIFKVAIAVVVPLGAVILFPLIASIRNTRLGDRLDPALILDAFKAIDNPTLYLMSELGGSARAIAHTFELVPSIRSFDWGISYVYALMTVIPNVWGGIHPTIAHGTPSLWLVQTVEPLTAAGGGGLGFSFIAEAYLNFGWLGMFTVMPMIGWLVGRLALRAGTCSEASSMALIACMIGPLLFYARSETADLCRSIVWYAVVPYLLARSIDRYSNNSRKLQ
jgi:oligosaccharide repeat unit polymerase